MKKEKFCSIAFKLYPLQLKQSEMLNFCIQGTDVRSRKTKLEIKLKSSTAYRNILVYYMLQSIFDTCVAACLAISLQ